jgi:hypothetical protein
VAGRRPAKPGPYQEAQPRCSWAQEDPVSCTTARASVVPAAMTTTARYVRFIHHLRSERSPPATDLSHPRHPCGWEGEAVSGKR